MGYKNREIEIKLVVMGTRRMADVNRRLAIVLNKYRRLIGGDSEDTYFHAPKGARADFVRLRKANRDDGAKFTLKYADKGNNFDRVERDTTVKEYKTMLLSMQDLFGVPAGVIRKRYIVYFMGQRGNESDTTVSLYQIKNDPRVFLEVEGKSSGVVEYWLGRIRRALPYDLQREYRSLFQIYIRPRSNLKKRIAAQ